MVVEVKVPHPNNVKQIGVLTKKALVRVTNQTSDRLTRLSGLTNGCVFGPRVEGDTPRQVGCYGSVRGACFWDKLMVLLRFNSACGGGGG